MVVTIDFLFYIHVQYNFNCLLFSQFAYICYFPFFSHQIINNFLTVIAVTFLTTACLFIFLYFCYLYLTGAYLQYQSKPGQHCETVDSFVSLLIVKESIQNSVCFLATAISIASQRCQSAVIIHSIKLAYVLLFLDVYETLNLPMVLKLLQYNSRHINLLFNIL